MTPILLLDLDETLISNSIQAFQPAYLNALCYHLRNSFEGERIVIELLNATQAMISNDRPDWTLEEVFDSIFYPALGINKIDLVNEIDTFYRDVFPSLKNLTAPRPLAQKIIRSAMDKGWQLILATNPLFPRTAILQRLDWAGLPLSEFSFDLIPSYETFHFAKPNLAYYGEILAQIGCPTEPVLMVGNDLELDIIPASQFGLQTFWLNPNKAQPGQVSFSPSFHGDLNDLLTWVDTGDHTSTIKEFNSIPSLLATLKATPAALSTLLKQISHEGCLYSPAGTEWGYTEIICHLRDVDREVNLPRFKKLISEDNPFFAAVDSDIWVVEQNYRFQDIQQALSEFLEIRIEIIVFLEQLTPLFWSKFCRHAIFGPTKLFELVGFSASHDRNHLAQWLKVTKTVTHDKYKKFI